MTISILKSLLILTVMGSFVTLMLLVLRPVLRKLGGIWQSLFWLMALTAFLLPLTIPVELPASLRFNAVSPQQQAPTTPYIPTPQSDAQTTQGPQTPLTARPVPISAAGLLTVLWLCGTVYFVLLTSTRYLRFTHTIRSSVQPFPCPTLDALTAGCKRTNRLTAAVSPLVDAPLLMGLWRPVLLLPQRELSPVALQHAIAHELTHFRRRDILLKWLATAVNALHWFNPLAYVAVNQLSEACELACDATVTRQMTEDEKKDYMGTILSFVAPNTLKTPPLTTGMACGMGQLKRRFTMIQRTNRRKLLSPILSLILCLSLLTGTLLVGGATAAALSAKGELTVTVFNGDTKIPLKNQPFVEEDELYLPLRDILEAFGGQVTWQNDTIAIQMPPISADNKAAYPASAFSITIGDRAMQIPEDNDIRTLRHAPMLRNGNTYVTIDFFETLILCGQTPRLQCKIDRSDDPKDYYADGEEVYIGTVLQQDAYNPVNPDGSLRLVKRILVDEQGKALAVVPIEYQISENLVAWCAQHGRGGYGSYENMYSSNTFTYNAYGEAIFTSDYQFIKNKFGGDKLMAYIPLVNQIGQDAIYLKK